MVRCGNQATKKLSSTKEVSLVLRECHFNKAKYINIQLENSLLKETP